MAAERHLAGRRKPAQLVAAGFRHEETPFRPGCFRRRFAASARRAAIVRAGTTAAGLPPNTLSVNASIWYKARRVISGFFGRDPPSEIGSSSSSGVRTFIADPKRLRFPQAPRRPVLLRLLPVRPGPCFSRSLRRSCRLTCSLCRLQCCYSTTRQKRVKRRDCSHSSRSRNSPRGNFGSRRGRRGAASSLECQSKKSHVPLNAHTKTEARTSTHWTPSGTCFRRRKRRPRRPPYRPPTSEPPASQTSTLWA